MQVWILGRPPPPTLVLPNHRPCAWLRLVSHVLLGKSVAAGAPGCWFPYPGHRLCTLLFLSLGPKFGFCMGLVKSEDCTWPCWLPALALPQGVYDRCEALLRPPFDACHAYVSPLPFTASCTSDLCQ